MADDELVFDAGELRAAIPKIGKLLFTNMRLGLTAISEHHGSQVKRLHRAGARHGRRSKSSGLGRPTGRLMDTLDGEVKPSSGGAESLDRLRLDQTIGGGVPYANVQEKGTRGAGGTLPDIVPKKAKVLTMPLPAARTAGGDVRGGIKTFDGYWDKSKAGNLIFFSKKDRTPLFLGIGPGLKKESVAIAPRLRFLKTFKKFEPKYIVLLTRGVRSALDGKRLVAKP